MKPGAFAYLAPNSLANALELLEQHGSDAKILAGGQSLVPMMSFRLSQPALLIDLNGIDELCYYQRGDDRGLRIGALSRQRSLEKEPLVAEQAPLLREAVHSIAHPQIRNRGTIGGSIAHADPAAELPALAVALRARFRLVSTRGSRWVAAQDFFRGLLTTDLEPEEMLVEIALPRHPMRCGSAFLEIARRHGDYAQVGAAAVVILDSDGICEEARLVFLSVGDVPMEATRAAAMLRGERLTEEFIAACAEHAGDNEIDPTTDIHATADYKRHLAKVLARRAFTVASERARAQLRKES
ncbi:MAG: xanthine dehydrogenase family protein subunit M [Deltaproteobacteria bacterium]|nr:xanthine dehydrogenase family protein subunit M [Deltaproteobacteria bacterium]